MDIGFPIAMIVLALCNVTYCITKIIEDRRAQRIGPMAYGLIALTGVVVPLVVLGIVSMNGSEGA